MRTLQRHLARIGAYTGPVDGQRTPEVEDALDVTLGGLDWRGLRLGQILAALRRAAHDVADPVSHAPPRRRSAGVADAFADAMDPERAEAAQTSPAEASDADPGRESRDAYAWMVEGDRPVERAALVAAFPGLAAYHAAHLVECYSRDRLHLRALAGAVAAFLAGERSQAERIGIHTTALSEPGRTWLERHPRPREQMIAPLEAQQAAAAPDERALIERVLRGLRGVDRTVTTTARAGATEVTVTRHELADPSAYLSLFGDINATVGSKVPAPEKLHLDTALTTSDLGVGVEPLGETMTMPRAIQFQQGRFTEDRDVLEAIAAHEYGHVLFDESGDRSSELQRVADNAVREAIALRQRLGEAHQRLRGNRDPDESARIHAEIESLGEEIELLDKITLDVHNVTSPYNELVADIVATLFTGDGSRVARFLEEVGGKEPGQAQLRDFTIAHTSDSVTERAAHVVLAPARALVWQAYMAHAQRGHDARADILAAVIEASWKEIDRRLLAGDFPDAKAPPSPAALNEPLLELLRADPRIGGAIE